MKTIAQFNVTSQTVVTFRFREGLKTAALRAEYARIEKYLDTARGFRHQMRHMCRDGNYAVAAYLLPLDQVLSYLCTVPSIEAETVHVRPP